MKLASATFLVLLSPALLAASADPLPVGAGLRARFDEKGVWRLEGEKGVFLVRCGLRVWSKARFVHQSAARAVDEPADGPTGRTFHGILRVGKRLIRYWQTATPTPKGLLIQYAVHGPDLLDDEEIAAGFDLPLDTFRNASCTVGAADPVILPAAKAPSPRLIEQAAGRLAVRRNGLTLALQRRPSGRIIVQDGREWQDPYFHVLLYAGPAVGDPPGVRSIAFHLQIGEPPAGPILAAVAPGKGMVPCHATHETEVHFWAPCENPFRGDVAVTAAVTAPSGQPFETRGFYTRDFAQSVERGVESLRPDGHGRWRLRITPREPGVHRYVVKVTTPAGEAAAKPISFQATPSPAPGFLLPPSKQSRYLETADGRPVFLIGHNYCWPAAKAPVGATEAALARMARSGINATRLWLCSWGLGIEGTRPDQYRLGGAWRLDRILEAARKHGVYVQLCLDNFTDLSAQAKAATHPYLARNGGPCRKPEEFFTSPRAKAQYQRRLSYLAARYAPLASVLAWELCSEVDYAMPDRRDPALLAWTRDAVAHLKRRDPYRHPVTLSLGVGSHWRELWEIDGLHLAQAHAYLHRPAQARSRAELDGAALLVRETDRLASSGKPMLIAEFGFLGTSDLNPLNDADKTGIHLHNALWASAMAGCAGTAMHWWWDSYLARRDLYYHYAAIARFFRGEALPDADWRPFRDKGDGPIRVLGLRGRTGALVWIQHRDNRWHRRLVESGKPTPLPSAVIDLAGFAPGRYRIEWWDTYAGQPITHRLQPTADGKLPLRVPRGHPDVACKVRRIAQ
ncbi:MAG: DUF5060 domain-containing protein [Candidatus Brocadiae bacterium]|nr:DUF5060 domain-containing protein [Candidatus Brocadiia bacterium]